MFAVHAGGRPKSTSARSWGTTRSRRRPRALRGLAAGLVSVVALACTAEDGSQSGLDAPVVRVGVLPDQEPRVLRAQYGPLLSYLDEAADVRTELTIPASYGELLDQFAAGQLDLAWFGGLTFLQADADGEARPLVMRDVDLEFTSDFLVRAAAPGDTIEDFAGATLAFGPELSTSGHLMPRYFIEHAGVRSEDLFGEIVHSAGHDQTARWVRDGVVDIGAVNSTVVAMMFRSGELTDHVVRIVATTTPFRNYTWATTVRMDDELRIRLQDAFLALDGSDRAHRAILSDLGANGFVPASRSDFVELDHAATALGFLTETDGTP